MAVHRADCNHVMAEVRAAPAELIERVALVRRVSRLLSSFLYTVLLRVEYKVYSKRNIGKKICFLT